MADSYKTLKNLEQDKCKTIKWRTHQTTLVFVHVNCIILLRITLLVHTIVIHPRMNKIKLLFVINTFFVYDLMLKVIQNLASF